MSEFVTAYYSLKTGNRVTEKFGLANPNYIRTFIFEKGTIAPEFLDPGHTLPRTLEKAKAAELARLEAVKKALVQPAVKKTAVKKVVLQKATAKKTRVVKRDMSDGEFAAATEVGASITPDVIPTAGNAPKKLKKDHTCAPVVKKTAAKKVVKKVAVSDAVKDAKNTVRRAQRAAKKSDAVFQTAVKAEKNAKKVAKKATKKTVKKTAKKVAKKTLSSRPMI